jgi:hypothetical protein
MKINNLNHIEVATQDIVGGFKYKPKYKPSATATAGAEALAIGKITVTKTYTAVEAVSGVFSYSGSSSYASATK